MTTDNLEVKVRIGAKLREIKNALCGLRSALKKSGSIALFRAIERLESQESTNGNR